MLQLAVAVYTVIVMYKVRLFTDISYKIMWLFFEIQYWQIKSALCCGSLDNTVDELKARYHVRGSLNDEYAIRDSSNHSHDFIDYAHDPLARQPFVSGNESSSELDDQASSHIVSLLAYNM